MSMGAACIAPLTKSLWDNARFCGVNHEHGCSMHRSEKMPQRHEEQGLAGKSAIPNSLATRRKRMHKGAACSLRRAKSLWDTGKFRSVEDAQGCSTHHSAAGCPRWPGVGSWSPLVILRTLFVSRCTATKASKQHGHPVMVTRALSRKWLTLRRSAQVWGAVGSWAHGGLS